MLAVKPFGKKEPFFSPYFTPCFCIFPEFLLNNGLKTQETDYLDKLY
jgi:hypothetical protein